MTRYPWQPPTPSLQLPPNMPDSYRRDLPERPVCWSWAPDPINTTVEEEQ